MPTCRLCNEVVDKLVDSHIYPRALNNVGGGSSAPLALIGPTKLSRSPTGIYDQFLCHGCEDSFKLPDEHFIRLARCLDLGSPIVDARDDELVGRSYDLSLADPQRLRLFGMSLLLRAHLTKQAFFHAVDVGPHYDRLSALVRACDCGSPNDFAVNLMRPVGAFQYSGMAPARVSPDGANGYLFRLPLLWLSVKVDRRPHSGSYRQVQVTEGEPVVIGNYIASPEEAESLTRLVRPHLDRMERLFGSRAQ